MALFRIATLADCHWHDLKDIEAIAGWPLAARGLVLLGVFLLGVVPVNQLVNFRLGEERQLQEQEGVALRLELEQLSLSAAALPVQKAGTLAREQTLEAIHRQLPEQEQMAELLDSILAAGQGKRLEFVSVGLEPIRLHSFYADQPIRMQVLGSYHGFASFIGAVAALPRLVILQDFSLEHVADGPLSIDFTLAVYYRDPASTQSVFSLNDLNAANTVTTHSGAASRAASYAAIGLRSPFAETGAGLSAEASDPAVAPIDRPADPLESFPLSELAMVGSISHGKVTHALVRDGHGRVHRVGVNNYMGQDHGRIHRVTATRIEMMETVQAGTGWIQRPRVLLLQDACPGSCQLVDWLMPTGGIGE